METKGNNESRFFIQDLENKAWQIFSLSQNNRDGSIYLFSPEFTTFEWLTFEIKENELKTFKIQQDKEGHISFHGHGQVHIKERDEPYKLPVLGQHLLKIEGKDIGLRHLFTIFPKKPSFLPPSQALNRNSDQLIKSNEILRPFVMVAFALPRKGFRLNFHMSFDIEDLETIPGGMLGFHSFPLLHHGVFVILYRTKNMNDWPKRSMLQYLDGITVPLFFGKPDRMISVQFRQTSFSLAESDLNITL